jgi:hypothetical protein
MNKLKREYQFFKQQTSNVRVLLMTNLLYAFVLPVVEIFVGAYVMRHTSEPVSVAFYQLFMYIGIIATSFVNGFLLRHVSVKVLYAGGILVSGLSMFAMMLVKSLGFVELGIAGFVLGAASGFFWTNRYLLTLNNTTDNSRNYFFGLESFFFSITSITVPLLIGAFISQIAGGPHSVRRLSKYPLRGLAISLSSLFSFSTGAQSVRLSEVAAHTAFSPQYIKYLPATFSMTSLPSFTPVTIEADLLARLAKRPLYAFAKASPCFVQFFKSLEVATAKRGRLRFQAV